MKKSVVFFGALLVCFISFIAFNSFVPTANAAGSMKIGVVDFQKILTSSSQGKRLLDELNRKSQVMEDDMKAKDTELAELQKKFEKDAVVMSKEKKEEKQRELLTKINDFKSLRAKYRKELNELNSVNMNKISKDVMALAAEIGKKEGLTMIIERNEGGIMYFDGSLDITDKVISEFNKKPASK